MMIFLSTLLRRNVVDNADRRIGLLDDLYVTPNETFPVITALVVRTSGNAKILIPWNQVKTLSTSPIQLAVSASSVASYTPERNEVLLGLDILDKQIVDRRGLRVVKVNDLQIVQTRQVARLVGADISWSGLLRRLGLLSIVHRLCRIFSISLSARTITWNYVEPIQMIHMEEVAEANVNRQLIPDLATVGYSGIPHVKLSVSQDTLYSLCAIDLTALVEKIDVEQRENYNELDYAFAL
jgi:magnesium transporter